MAELYDVNGLEEFVRKSPTARVRLQIEDQRKLFESVEEKHALSHTQLAHSLKVHTRTLSDWRHGKGTLPLKILIELIRKFEIVIPRNLSIIDRYWYTRVGAPLGGKATYKKYCGIPPSEKYRSERWQAWWEKTGKYKKTNFGERKVVNKLRKTAKVAELIGILLGDGHIDTYQISITLNARDDRSYATYVTQLLAEVSGVSPSITKRNRSNVFIIRLSRVAIIEDLRKLGVTSKNKVKDQVDIPNWIKLSAPFSRACIRGLWDTDGCIYEEVHRKTKKHYRYPRLSLVSHSMPLLSSVTTLLSRMDFSPKIRNNRSVQLESRADIVKYFQLIGSSNAKHCERYSKFVT